MNEKGPSYYIPQVRTKRASTGLASNRTQFRGSSRSTHLSDLSNVGFIHVPQRKCSHYCVAGVTFCTFQINQFEAVCRISLWKDRNVSPRIGWLGVLGCPFNPVFQPWGSLGSEVGRQSVPLQNGILASFVATLSYCHFPASPIVLSKPWIATS